MRDGDTSFYVRLSEVYGCAEAQSLFYTCFLIIKGLKEAYNQYDTHKNNNLLELFNLRKSGTTPAFYWFLTKFDHNFDPYIKKSKFSIFNNYSFFKKIPLYALPFLRPFKDKFFYHYLPTFAYQAIFDADILYSRVDNSLINDII